MSAPPELPEEVRRHIAKQVGAMLPRDAGVGFAASARMGESLPVYRLTMEDLQRSDPLSTIGPTGQWHHQIYRNERPVAFASSFQRSGEEEHQIATVFDSPVAVTLDRAINFADSRFPQEGEARLLRVASHGVHALWILPQNGPQALIPVFEQPLDVDADVRVYSPEEFLDMLRRQGPRSGLTP